MQPIKRLTKILASLTSNCPALFSLDDLQGAHPGHSRLALRALVSRAEKAGVLQRVCRGLYLYPPGNYPGGQILFHAASRLRAEEFNYISLESALSDAGVISQIPTNWLTLMSSGRGGTISCGKFGTIEFVHTAKQPGDLAGELSYDSRCHLWRASVSLAIRDMKAARRNLELIDWGVVHESV